MNSYAVLGPIDPIIEVNDDYHSYSELKELINIKDEAEVDDRYILAKVNGIGSYQDTFHIMNSIFRQRHRYIKKRRNV